MRVCLDCRHVFPKIVGGGALSGDRDSSTASDELNKSVALPLATPDPAQKPQDGTHDTVGKEAMQLGNVPSPPGPDAAAEKHWAAPSDMDTDYLTELAFQLYARSCNPVISRGVHERSVELVNEVRNRLSENASLRARIKSLEQILEDECETDKNVRNLARPLLGDSFVDGGGYVTPLEDIVEKLLARSAPTTVELIASRSVSAELTAENAQLRETVEKAAQQLLLVENALPTDFEGSEEPLGTMVLQLVTERDRLRETVEGFCREIGEKFGKSILGLGDVACLLGMQFGEIYKLRARIKELEEELQAFTKHVGASSFEEAVDVSRRTNADNMDALERTFNQVKSVAKERDQLRGDLARVTKALSDVMPFVLEEYYPECATPEFKCAVDGAVAALANSKTTWSCVTDQQIQAEAEAWAWEVFAEAHPHEAFATWPERFWEFYHAKCPDVSREQMEALLAAGE